MVKGSKSKVNIYTYPSEKYSILFDKASGFFARIEDWGFPEPLWSEHGPELLDISITNWCDRGCAICYRSSSKDGRNMSLGDYEKIMQQARNIKVLQVALGGGNPNQHPDFTDILKLTSETYGIVPNYTTNGRGLNEKTLKASQRYCGAVAVSGYEPYQEMITAIKMLSSCNIRTNIHYVLTSKSVHTAINWLMNPPEFLHNINAIIFLNYKPVGNAGDVRLLLNNSDRVSAFFDAVKYGNYFFKIGFDSCSVSGIANYMDINSKYYDFCDAGRFSAFISEDCKMYPCSFMIDQYEGVPIDDDNILEQWKNNAIFKNIRNRQYNSKCHCCNKYAICRGGCPIFPEINICSQMQQ